jgi:pimeloyl-ACP methyl ester carboxylesterase
MQDSMQNHYISGDIRTAKKMRTYWAVKPEGTAIIFVHGWKGEAVGTWSDFERLLSSSSACRGVDLIFYTYDSLREPTLASSADLYKYLKLLFKSPLQKINKDLIHSTHRQPQFHYDRILLIGHSLGAVICRQALLRAYQSGDKWPKKTELVLFAPAHLGAPNIISFATEIAGFLKIPILIAAAEFWLPTINELKENSSTLKELASGTALALASGKANYLRAKKVLFGKHERIVTVGNFCEDAPADFFANKGHTDVCKPKDAFPEPLTEILGLL